VSHSGGAGKTLTLPPAASQGSNVGAVLFLLNTSPNAVTIARGSADTVAGAASVALAAGALMVLASDGATKWLKAP
jgi:hypothetical protein